MTSPAAQVATRYQRTFHGRADQVSQVRGDVTQYLGDCPAADDAVLIASELAANAVVHSASTGEFFTVRCERYPGYVWVEVEDLGGPWLSQPALDHPHGLYIVDALAGPGNWGTETTSDGDRIVWARLDLPPREEGQVTHGQPPLTCRDCQMTDPPPEQTCTEGRDHRVGIAAGCPGCGRLTAACQRRPCSARLQLKQDTRP